MSFFTNRPTSWTFRNSVGRATLTRLILLPIEVPGCRVHSNDEFRVRRKRALQETVVRFVPDDTELGQRIAHGKALDDLRDEFRVVAEDVRVLFEDGRTDPRLDQTGVRELVDECRGVVVGGKVASFRMEVSRTTREARSGASQRSFALLASDEPDRLGLGHAFPAILVVRAGLCWGQLEPENLAANDGRGIHGTSVFEGSH